MERLLRDDVDLHSTNDNVSADRRCPFLNARAHNLLYGGVRLSSRVCAGVCKGMTIVSCNETCRMDIRSIDD